MPSDVFLTTSVAVRSRDVSPPRSMPLLIVAFDGIGGWITLNSEDRFGIVDQELIDDRFDDEFCLIHLLGEIPRLSAWLEWFTCVPILSRLMFRGELGLESISWMRLDRGGGGGGGGIWEPTSL